MPIQTRLTANEFLDLPDSNIPTELLDGKLIMRTIPPLTHQRVSARLFQLLSSVIQNGELFFAPVHVCLDEFNVVQPDLLWVAAGSSSEWVDAKYLRGGPDLTVEILAPETARRDKKDKFRLYEKYGVREYWIIDPEGQWLEVWQRQNERFTLLDVYGPLDQVESPLLGSVQVHIVFAVQKIPV